MFTTILSSNQTDMMKHAYGYNTRKPGFRTHYCTNLDDVDMLDMVEKGYFKGPIGVGSVGENHGIFHLTEKGVSTLKDIKKQEKDLLKKLSSPKTESQPSFPDFLDDILDTDEDDDGLDSLFESDDDLD